MNAPQTRFLALSSNDTIVLGRLPTIGRYTGGLRRAEQSIIIGKTALEVIENPIRLFDNSDRGYGWKTVLRREFSCVDVSNR
jgi:hypothetical protein